jgi:hypothetical protein
MASFVLETTRPGRLPKKTFMVGEETAREQMRKAVQSGQFERIVLIYETGNERKVLYDSVEEAKLRFKQAADASVIEADRTTRRASSAMVAGLIIVVIFYALKWMFNA